MEDTPRPTPVKSYFLMGWEYAAAHPQTYSPTYVADRLWKHLWIGQYSRRWWIDGFNAYRDLCDERREAKQNRRKKG